MWTPTGRAKSASRSAIWPCASAAPEKHQEAATLPAPKRGNWKSTPTFRPILTRPINWEISEQQYDQLIKFATALGLGTADAESILRRFTKSNLQHPACKHCVSWTRL
jgi:TnpA family transposase